MAKRPADAGAGSARSMTLERHGVRFRFNFLTLIPEYNAVPEPWWDEADLTPEQESELAVWTAQHKAARPEDSDDLIRYWTLERNGVHHTHRRGKPIFDHRPAYGYECSMCRTTIVATDPGDYRFIGGPADGRWYVTDGRPVWMVPIPQPVTVAVGALDRPTFDTATYYRRGDLYVAAQPLTAPQRGATTTVKSNND